MGLIACNPSDPAPESLEIHAQDIPGISIRAIDVLNEDICWFAGSNGHYGYTLDGGLSWHVDSIPEAHGYELRSLSAINDSTVLVLNADRPARIWRTSNRGRSWSLVFSDSSAGVFFDSMRFWDSMQGLAFGDPNNGCFHIIITRDGGNSWRRVACENLPEHHNGEAAFAASNTNIDCFGPHAWIATGGKAARILRTPDYGHSWNCYDSPMIQGQDMTGTFSLDMWDSKKAIAIGGNWEEPEDASSNLMVTSEGPAGWSLVENSSHPGYRSCIQFVPGHKGNWIMAVGYPGMDISDDGGQKWLHLNDDKWYGLRFDPLGKKGFLCGPGKVGYFHLP
jgi:photosystem II stability/assembly factor-like uncharacterized protein